MVKSIFKYTLITFMVVIVLFVGYIAFNLIFYKGIIVPFVKMENEEIVKKAVKSKDLKGKNYIICQPVAITGYNFKLIVDENGNRANDDILVSGSNPDSEGLSYDFMTSGNYFVFYIVDKKETHYKEMGKDCVNYEYIADGWDILYPAKHDSPITDQPRYIVKSDYVGG